MSWHLKPSVPAACVYWRQEDDGPCSVPLPEDRRQLHLAGVLQVRVPAHREGGLAEPVQDQVRDGGLALLQERWDKCGPAFDAVVAENPTGPDAAAAFASVLCYQKMYDQIYKGDADRGSKGLGPKGGTADKDKDKSEWEEAEAEGVHRDPEEGMVTAFNRYVTAASSHRRVTPRRTTTTSTSSCPRSYLLRVSALGGSSAGVP
ncbi:MAG: hypothetical protein R3B07_34635 [Polyangiaceae bacterium]